MKKKTVICICLLLVLVFICVINRCSKTEDVIEINIETKSEDIKDENVLYIVLKDEYKESILYEISEELNPDNYVEYERNKGYLLDFRLVEEDKENYKTEGEYLIEFFIKDDKGNEVSVRTKLISIEINEEETKEENTEEEGKRSGHYEMVLVKEAYDETVAAHDEKRLKKDAWIEEVLRTEGYSETIEYCKEYGRDSYFGYTCSGCQHSTASLDEIQRHISEDFEDGCGSYSGGSIYYGEAHCLLMDSYEIYHEPVYDYVFHEAEYEMVHISEKIIHHPAKYKKVYINE